MASMIDHGTRSGRNRDRVNRLFTRECSTAEHQELKSPKFYDRLQQSGIVLLPEMFQPVVEIN